MSFSDKLKDSKQKNALYEEEHKKDGNSFFNPIDTVTDERIKELGLATREQLERMGNWLIDIRNSSKAVHMYYFVKGKGQQLDIVVLERSIKWYRETYHKYMKELTA